MFVKEKRKFFKDSDKCMILMNNFYEFCLNFNECGRI